MKPVNYLLIFIISLPPTAVAQSNYGDYEPVGEEIYYEGFSDNYREWNLTSDSEKSYDIRNGNMIFAHYRQKGTWNKWSNEVELDESTDYEIESRLKIQKSDYPGFSSGLFWGGKGGDDNFFFSINANGSYRLVKRLDGDWSYFTEWVSDKANPEGEYNTLTIRKVRSTYYFFLNYKLIETLPVEPFLGDRVGWTANKGTTLHIDYLKVTSIRKANAAKGSSYFDFPPSERQVVFDEKFNDNQNNWLSSTTDDYELGVRNGVYRMQKKNTGTKRSQISFPLDESNDFEIETTARLTRAAKTTTGHWMHFGGDNNGQYYYLLFNGDGEYRIGKREDTGEKKEYVPLVDWTKSSSVRGLNYDNKLTFRKVGKKFYFFINENMVYSTYSRPFYGDKMGMVVGSNATLELDYYKVTMLGAPKNPKLIVQRYANQKLKEWAKKDEFERTSEYQARVTDANLKAKAQEFQNEKLQELKEVQMSKFNISSFSLEAYDADNETYLINGPNRQYVVPIPYDNARSVKGNFYNASISDQDFILTDEGFKLSAFTLVVPGTGQFNWDHLQDHPYQSMEVTYNIADLNLGIATGTVSNNTNITKKQITVGQSDVDINIPTTALSNPDAIAVVIGNTNYQGDIPNVDFAIHDAEIMKKYLEKTFGFRPGNILFQKNATKTKMEVLLGNAQRGGKLANYVKAGKSDVFFFYSGHGAPDTNTKTGYLMPVDSDPSTLAITGYSIETLYGNLSKLNARSVQVVIDACFSGGSSSGQMLINQASPIGIQVKNPAAQISNGTIVTASQGDQISSWYAEKSHGLFTYFYLKGLRGEADLDGDRRVTSSEMKRYLQNSTEGVPYWARRLHGRDQVPEVFSGGEQVIVQLN